MRKPDAARDSRIKRCQSFPLLGGLVLKVELGRRTIAQTRMRATQEEHGRGRDPHDLVIERRCAACFDGSQKQAIA
jgi:hypothetical protein